jgi:hypothetical protein
MADDPKNGGNPPTDPKGTPGATDPKANPGSGAPSTVDFSKLGDEELVKALEDPRIWNTPRLKELREAAKEAKALKEAQAKEQEEAAKKKGEWETLAQQREKERDEAKAKLNETIIDNGLMVEASKKGIARLDLVKKLIDRSKLKINDDGTIEGISQTLDALIAENKFLLTNSNPSLSSGTNPGGVDTSTGTFKMSQIENVEFYQAHEKEIKQALLKGKIIYDTD